MQKKRPPNPKFRTNVWESTNKKAPINHEVLCPCRDRHNLPVIMALISVKLADNGLPMAIFACPYSGCAWREGWLRDLRTPRPIRLWAGRHK